MARGKFSKENVEVSKISEVQQHICQSHWNCGRQIRLMVHQRILHLSSMFPSQSLWGLRNCEIVCINSYKFVIICSHFHSLMTCCTNHFIFRICLLAVLLASIISWIKVYSSVSYVLQIGVPFNLQFFIC